ncbi:TetR/AcrR family transcriptional regulator [Aeromicrobium phragmitis]|uniref:TetR/AcrR family transcriptional regulator n=1 Tax=Aeromicrobium phragmitis TaxID=2478914 RepID=A0A3L8PL88_9ACTN|nr:TetR/AcrR family transcriptional regulator [Aeromicrobium phragmitis]RLV56010.1 TetR/AcrR family transcriptional regulator [Aeromicrobium phragmitis]
MTDQESDDRLSPTLRRLWGRESEGRRGPKAALSVDRIVRTAVEIADAEGLAAVSMARVGQELGYSSMALYRHIASKDELLTLMGDRFAGEPPTLVPGEGWRAGLSRWTRVQVEQTVARPWVLDLPLAAMYPGPTRLRWIDAGMGCLRDVALPGEDKLAILGLLAQYVLGEVRVQVESGRAAIQSVREATGVGAEVPDGDLDPAAIAAANIYADFESQLRELADPKDFPHLFDALADVAPEPSADVQDSVEFGLRIVLDGIARYIEEHASG